MKTTRIVVILALALALTSGIASADFTFGEPTKLGPTVNSSRMEYAASVSADGRTLYFCSNRPGGSGGNDLWISTRATIDEPWGEAVNLGAMVNSSNPDGYPSISADGLTLYFSAYNRSGGRGLNDIWMTARATTDDPWEKAVNIGSPVNSSGQEFTQCISADGLSLYFASNRSGGSGEMDLWLTTRATIADDWSTPMNLGFIVNSSSYEFAPSISADGNTLFFDSGRSGGFGNSDIWMTRRNMADGDWTTPVNLGNAINTSNAEESPSISADGRTLYFCSNRTGSGELWQMSIEPVIDLNGDGIVDSADMCIIVDYWGTDNSLCDIGPMPWGDGVVDVQDLIVLSEHLFEKVEDPSLFAHWALDETEGEIAADSVAELDGTVHGEALWQPEDGIVGGALEFDGIDDYVGTPSFMLTANISCSVFAWIKGGIPGQVIFSQKGRSDWLLADTTNGSLMTELEFLFKPRRALQSQTVITDGNWHHVGLVWDGSNRILYVDDVEVVSDTCDKGLLNGELQIGAGNKLEAGTFWSGLIDDVRIYDRAVMP